MDSGERPAAAGRAALKDRDPVALWAVWVSEVEAPDGVEALDWLLLTTVPVHTLAEAQERVAWYRVRWTVEVWHLTSKSGCAFEQRQLASADHLRRALALYDVVAWRIDGMLLARVAPEVPCTVLFEVQEWQALFVRCTRHQRHRAVRRAWGRRCAGWPSWAALWGAEATGSPGRWCSRRGFVRLVDMTHLFTVFTAPPQHQHRR